MSQDEYWSKSGYNYGSAWRPNGNSCGPGPGPQNEHQSQNGGGGSTSEMQQLLNQVQQLQQKVMQLSQQGGAMPPAPPPPNYYGQGGGYNQSNNQNNHPPPQPRFNHNQGQNQLENNMNHGRGPDAGGNGKRILLVSNIPQNLSSCDSIYFMFERFGRVERVKILHKKRDTALVQMASTDMADKAVNEQNMLTRTCPDIFVNYSNNVTHIKLPQESGFPEDGLSRDYTGDFQQQPPPAHQHQHQGPRGGGGGGGGQPPMPPPPPPPSYHHSNGQTMPPGPGGPPVNNGCVVLASSLPEALATPDRICNLFGFYGDVHRVKILHNKKDCALVQMAKPHQATMVRNYIDQIKVAGSKICVSFSRMPSIKLPQDKYKEENESSTKDFTNIKGVHRFRNPIIANKLGKNLCAPTSLLHIANMPEKFGQDELRSFLQEEGFTVKEVMDCGKDKSGMALVSFGSEEEAVLALAKLHNTTPKSYQTKNNSGLCLSFSNRKINQ